LARRGEFEAAAHKLRSRIGQHATDEDRRLLAKCLYHLDAKEQSAKAILAVVDKSWTDCLWAGKCYVSLKRWDEATSHLVAAQGLKETAAGYYWLAVAVARDEKYLYDDARKPVVDLLERALSLAQCPPEAYLWLEELQDWGDEGSNKVAILQKGLEAHPHSTPLRLRLAYLLAYRNPSLARSVLLPVLRSGGEPVETLWHWFQIEWNLGNLEGALDAIERLGHEHQDKSSGSGLNQIKGELLLELGREDDAIACFDAELEKPSDDARTLAILGRSKAHLAKRNIPAAVADACAAIPLWASYSYNGCLPGYPSLIEIDGKQFHYAHEPDDRLVEAFASQRDQQCIAIGQCLRYLIDRESKVFGLAQLQALQKSFDFAVLDYDLSRRYAEAAKPLWAVHHYLRFVCAGYDAHGWCPVRASEDLGRPEVSQEERAYIHAKIVECIVPRREDAQFVQEIVLPLYDDFWRELLINGNTHKELLDVASFLCQSLPEDQKPLFDKAFGLSGLGRTEEAEAAYREVISRRPNSPGALHNLSLLLKAKGSLDEATTLARRAAELVPDDSKIADNANALDRELEDRRIADQRQEDFLQTARERWPQLDYHKKRILTTLTVIKGFDDLNHLARLSGTGEQYIQGNWRKLIDLGMIVGDEHGKPCINKYILDLVHQERSHAVATTIIRAEDRIAFKPIFNSKWEYTVYSTLIGLFPNHLVFPNMALQTVFQYERMRELLDVETFRYFLMSQVDFCITSTASYLPIIAFEVDSPYHDLPEQRERDRKKNDIFRVGGVPLLRLRAHGQPGSAAIRDEIIRVVREVGRELADTERKAHGFVNITMEINFERFGMTAEPEQGDL
jgi:tetratricopeptide (TPR) repeat protein